MNIIKIQIFTELSKHIYSTVIEENYSNESDDLKKSFNFKCMKNMNIFRDLLISQALFVKSLNNACRRPFSDVRRNDIEAPSLQLWEVRKLTFSVQVFTASGAERLESGCRDWKLSATDRLCTFNSNRFALKSGMNSKVTLCAAGRAHFDCWNFQNVIIFEMIEIFVKLSSGQYTINQPS